MSVKLKESCSACAVSKLKCSKDKPTCKRCARRGQRCEYLPSNRAGRNHIINLASPRITAPTGSLAYREFSVESTDSDISLTLSELQASLDNRQSNSSTVPSRQPMLHSEPSYQDTNYWDWTFASSLPPHPAEYLTWATSSEPAPSAHAPPVLLHQPVPGIPWPTPPMSSCSITNPMPQFPDEHDIQMEPPLPCFAAENAPALGSAVSTIDPSLGASTTRTTHVDPEKCQQDACLGIAVHMLERVYNSSHSACTTRTSNKTLEQNPPPSQLSLVEAIEENKQTIETLSPMLECPCLHDELVVTLLPLVVMKIMASYRAAARRSLSDQAIPAPEEQLPRSRAHSLDDELPLRSELCPQDDHNQGRVAASLVLGELHRVQRLVNLLSIRIQSIGSRPSAETSIFSVELFERLEIDMKTHIQVASREIIDMLRFE